MAQTEREFGLGIVGFGGMAQFHREELEKIDGIHLRGTFDIKEERQEYAKELGLKAYQSLEALLEEESIDIILVATPNDEHKPIAIQAMRAGKHVISEKPVTLSSQDLKEMIQVSKETKRYFTVHQNRRWDEDFLTMKQVYDNGMLGPVYRIESRVHGSIGIPGDWRQYPEHGGGMVLDWGVHLLDQILLMAGRMPQKVYASTTNITNQLVDDGFRAELIFSDGLEALVEVGTSNFISLPRWYVLGQNGTALIKDWGDDAQLVMAKGETDRDVVPVVTGAGITKTMAPRREENIHKETVSQVKSDVKDFYRNVMASIQGQQERFIKLEEVADVMNIMEAIFTSAKTKQVVELTQE